MRQQFFHEMSLQTIPFRLDKNKYLQEVCIHMPEIHLATLARLLLSVYMLCKTIEPYGNSDFGHPATLLHQHFARLNTVVDLLSIHLAYNTAGS